ncbi:MAG: hypothetical protein WCL02_01310 [bacterium]
MKTKHLFFIAIGIISFLFLLVFIILPVISFYSPKTGVSIFFLLILIAVLLYVFNMPGHKIHLFHHHAPVIKLRLPKLRFTYRKSTYPFSCGHATIQMILEQYKVIMTQDEILEMSGDKNLGITPWEAKETLNKIFIKKELPLMARINQFTTYAQLFNSLQKGKGVIVMFLNHFREENFSSKSHYPHFALLNYIHKSDKENESKVVLTSPSYIDGGNENFKPGKYEGEIVMSLQEFQERFYTSLRFLNNLEYKPTHTQKKWVNRWHRFLNILFIFIFYIGYSTLLLKPGIAIFIETINEKSQ